MQHSNRSFTKYGIEQGFIFGEDPVQQRNQFSFQISCRIKRIGSASAQFPECQPIMGSGFQSKHDLTFHIGQFSYLLQKKIVSGAVVAETECLADALSILCNDDSFVAPLGNVDPNDEHGAASAFPVEVQTIPHVLMSHTLHGDLRRENSRIPLIHEIP